MKYVFGLGNPGLEYKKTRHNIGFSILEILQEEYNFSSWQFDKYSNAYVSEGSICGFDFTFVLPQTFMNNSGLTVAAFVKKKTSIEDVVVTYDDLAFPLGDLKVSHQSSAGGHNGISSIIDSLGTKDFIRIRLGIKTDVYNHLKEKSDKSVLADFVLKKFLKKEEVVFPNIAQKVTDALVLISKEGKEKAMTVINAL